MRLGKPEIGYMNMRKVTSNEAKLLGLDKKLMVKIRIMTNENGEVSFWLPNPKSGEVTLFNGTEDEYFDAKRANVRLEQYWASFTKKEEHDQVLSR